MVQVESLNLSKGYIIPAMGSALASRHTISLYNFLFYLYKSGNAA